MECHSHNTYQHTLDTIKTQLPEPLKWQHLATVSNSIVRDTALQYLIRKKLEQ